MSNIIDNDENKGIDIDFATTNSLRGEELPVVEEAPKVEVGGFKVKTPIKAADLGASFQPVPEERTYTKEDIVNIAKEIEARIRSSIATGDFNPNLHGQVMQKDKAPIKEIDFTKLTMDDVYDLTIPIQAKAFGATDALKVALSDKNYEARWVNKNPRRLGQMLAYGFIYVEKQDLAQALEVEISLDAQGHFVLDDVVLMRIPKQRYYAALRAAHQRAVNTVSSVGSAKAAESEANNFMSKESGGEFADLAQQGKVGFYRPGIEI